MKATSGPFHAGERAVQAEAGLAGEAEAVGRIVAGTIAPGLARFLRSQQLAVASSLDGAGRPWASLLAGARGFIEPVDERLLRLAVALQEADPLSANVAARPELGLLVIDLATRQRVRVNGKAQLRDEGLFLLADQVYGNCPKYIQKRAILARAPGAPAAPLRSGALDQRQQAWIAAADTFFIASYHAAGGADASHRGGRPGFVRVLDARRLRFPDYPGNAMFNTLGNLLEYPRAGLLFVDFAAGDLLQLSGRAEVQLGAERSVSFTVEQVLERRGAAGQRWELIEPSPANP